MTNEEISNLPEFQNQQSIPVFKLMNAARDDERKNITAPLGKTDDTLKKRPKNITDDGRYVEPFTFESDTESVLFHAYLESENYIDYLLARLSALSEGKTGTKESDGFRLLLGLHEEYIALLGEELNEVVPLASAHGWKSDRYERGKILREKIRIAKHLMPSLSKTTTNE